MFMSKVLYQFVKSRIWAIAISYTMGVDIDNRLA